MPHCLLLFSQASALMSGLGDPGVLHHAIQIFGIVTVVVVLAVALVQPSIEWKYRNGSGRIDFTKKHRRKAKTTVK